MKVTANLNLFLNEGYFSKACYVGVEALPDPITLTEQVHFK